MRAIARPLALFAVLLLAGCGDGGGTPDPERPPADLVQLRAVVSASASPPCVGGAVAFDGRCLVLGPVAVDADDVRTARVTATPPTGKALSLVFTPAGDKAYVALATQQLRGQVAVLVEGKVVAVPTVQSPDSSGGIVVTGVDDASRRRVAAAFAGTDS